MGVEGTVQPGLSWPVGTWKCFSVLHFIVKKSLQTLHSNTQSVSLGYVAKVVSLPVKSLERSKMEL